MRQKDWKMMLLSEPLSYTGHSTPRSYPGEAGFEKIVTGYVGIDCMA